MGGTDFEDYAFGKTVRDAYDAAVKSAIWEYGHDPYNGTISTTDGFVEIKCPKGLTSQEFQWIATDARWGEGLPTEMPPVRCKFDSEWERNRYLAYRKTVKKYLALSPSDKALVKKGSDFEKWGPCIALELPDKEQRHWRAQQPACKGKHGKFYLFYGVAAC
jgi:hypothetical protein